MNIPAAMSIWKAFAGKRNLTPFQAERLRAAIRVLKASKTSMVGNPRMTLEQATRAYMLQFADVAESGATEMTGKGRRDAGREGEFIGRFGGVKKSYPALDRLKAGPKAIAAAIREGKGRAKRNPSGNSPVMIYGRVLVVHAQKTQNHRCDAECKEKNHIYYHEFKDGAVMYGLQNGDILIRGEK